VLTGDHVLVTRLPYLFDIHKSYWSGAKPYWDDEYFLQQVCNSGFFTDELIRDNEEPSIALAKSICVVAALLGMHFFEIRIKTQPTNDFTVLPYCSFSIFSLMCP